MQLVEREDMEDEENHFEAIDKLISQGINAGDVKKLQHARIFTWNGLMMHTKMMQWLQDEENLFEDDAHAGIFTWGNPFHFLHVVYIPIQLALCSLSNCVFKIEKKEFMVCSFPFSKEER